MFRRTVISRVGWKPPTAAAAPFTRPDSVNMGMTGSILFFFSLMSLYESVHTYTMRPTDKNHYVPPDPSKWDSNLSYKTGHNRRLDTSFVPEEEEEEAGQKS
eukprot:TRINITY_DN21823_c0_g1_i1.p1 TRINITY_DN21823_c0_g1~~TRINITY_DN21823_c0_g1_i1.p1  ORF type:complete len:102 (+),score=18.75 TRINITY_DN21823_c0_g1_i1:80-385(+)